MNTFSSPPSQSRAMADKTFKRQMPNQLSRKTSSSEEALPAPLEDKPKKVKSKLLSRLKRHRDEKNQVSLQRENEILKAQLKEAQEMCQVYEYGIDLEMKHAETEEEKHRFHEILTSSEEETDCSESDDQQDGLQCRCIDKEECKQMYEEYEHIAPRRYSHLVQFDELTGKTRRVFSNCIFRPTLIAKRVTASNATASDPNLITLDEAEAELTLNGLQINTYNQNEKKNEELNVSEADTEIMSPEASDEEKESRSDSISFASSSTISCASSESKDNNNSSEVAGTEGNDVIASESFLFQFNDKGKMEAFLRAKTSGGESKETTEAEPKDESLLREQAEMSDASSIEKGSSKSSKCSEMTQRDKDLKRMKKLLAAIPNERKQMDYFLEKVEFHRKRLEDYEAELIRVRSRLSCRGKDIITE